MHKHLGLVAFFIGFVGCTRGSDDDFGILPDETSMNCCMMCQNTQETEVFVAQKELVKNKTGWVPFGIGGQGTSSPETACANFAKDNQLTACGLGTASGWKKFGQNYVLPAGQTCDALDVASNNTDPALKCCIPCKDQTSNDIEFATIKLDRNLEEANQPKNGVGASDVCNKWASAQDTVSIGTNQNASCASLNNALSFGDSYAIPTDSTCGESLDPQYKCCFSCVDASIAGSAKFYNGEVLKKSGESFYAGADTSLSKDAADLACQAYYQSSSNQSSQCRAKGPNLSPYRRAYAVLASAQCGAEFRCCQECLQEENALGWNSAVPPEYGKISWSSVKNSSNERDYYQGCVNWAAVGDNANDLCDALPASANGEGWSAEGYGRVAANDAAADCRYADYATPTGVDWNSTDNKTIIQKILSPPNP